MTTTSRAAERNRRASGAFAMGLLASVFSSAALAGFVDERPAPAAPAPVVAPAAAAPAAVVTSPVTSGTPAAAAATPSAAAPAAAAGGAQQPLTPVVAVAVAAPAATPAAQAIAFTVSREDHTVREVLARWSKGAGWSNEPEDWTVNFDLPINASANLGTDYKAAVRGLLDSTSLTNLPLQPCFYSNQVMRVVPKAELCDKTVN